MDFLSGISSAVLVARTLAQHYSRHIDEATRPHQFALSTRAGAEALAHSLQLETDTDPSCTVLSVDGIGAFDFVSRRAMLSELQHTPEACAMLPFQHGRFDSSKPSNVKYIR